MGLSNIERILKEFWNKLSHLGTIPYQCATDRHSDGIAIPVSQLWLWMNAGMWCKYVKCTGLHSLDW